MAHKNALCASKLINSTAVAPAMIGVSSNARVAALSYFNTVKPPMQVFCTHLALETFCMKDMYLSGSTRKNQQVAKYFGPKCT